LRHHLSLRPVTEDDHLWRYAGSVPTDEGIRRRLRKWGQLCEVAVTPHRLRHTFATRLLNQGVTFTAAAGTGASYAQNSALSAAVQQVYAFDASAAFSGTVSIQATDRADNTVTSHVALSHDAIAPTLTVNAAAEGLTLSMAWAASDAEAGLNPVC
jgi:hypothetical protein